MIRQSNIHLTAEETKRFNAGETPVIRERQQCSYGRDGGHCCVGVHFISRYRQQTDYCVDGVRVSVNDGDPLPKPIFLYELDQYADYLRWHQGFYTRFPDQLPTVHPQPFNYFVKGFSGVANTHSCIDSSDQEYDDSGRPNTLSCFV